MMTVGLDAAVVENDLRAGRPLCPWAGCGASLGPWCWARERRVRGAGRLQPRRGRCRGCGRTQVLLPASVLLRRAGGVGVIGLALLATPLGAGHRPIAETLKVPASTVRGWLRRIVSVAERVLAVLAAAAAQLGLSSRHQHRRRIRSRQWWNCSEPWPRRWPDAWVVPAQRGTSRRS